MAGMKKRVVRRSRVRPVFSVALIATLALAVWAVHQPVWAALRTHPYFAVKDLKLRGIGPLLDEQEVLSWLGIHEGTAIWDLSPSRVRRRLETHPLIHSAEVEREFPNRFEIEIRERRPEAIALIDDLYYLDREGALLRPLTPIHNPDFPVITGLTPETPAGVRAFSLRRAQRLMRLCERMSCLGGLSEVHLDAQRGIVVYPMAPRIEVVLGYGSWRQKLERASRVIEAWKPRIEQLAGIDVRYRNQALVQTVKQPEPAPKKAVVSKKKVAPKTGRAVRVRGKMRA